MRFPLSIAVLLAALLSQGCQLYFDVDTVDFVGVDTDSVDMPADTPPDMNPTDVDMTPSDADVNDMPDAMADADMPVTDMPTDVGLDMADMPDLVDMDTYGQTCPNPKPLPGTCSLVRQDCPQGQFCDIKLPGGNAESGCVLRDPDREYILQEGEACGLASDIRCEDGLRCRIDVCVRYCDLVTGFGCDPEQFCVPFDPNTLEGVGFCSAACP